MKFQAADCFVFLVGDYDSRMSGERILTGVFFRPARINRGLPHHMALF
jgi:hypothetical protein